MAAASVKTPITGHTPTSVTSTASTATSIKIQVPSSSPSPAAAAAGTTTPETSPTCHSGSSSDEGDVRSKRVLNLGPAGAAAANAAPATHRRSSRPLLVVSAGASSGGGGGECGQVVKQTEGGDCKVVVELANEQQEEKFGQQHAYGKGIPFGLCG